MDTITLDTDTLNCAIGFAGGVAAELLGLYKITRIHDKLPAMMKKLLYWVMSFFMCVLGALLVFIYTRSGVTMIPILAFNIGVSAPLIIGNMTKHDVLREIP
jgi:hypothetical protein